VTEDLLLEQCGHARYVWNLAPEQRTQNDVFSSDEEKTSFVAYVHETRRAGIA
jgi:hypothetical protein